MPTEHEAWTHTTLGEVASIEMGQSPSGSATNHDGNGMPLIGGASDFVGEGLSASRFTTEPTKLCEPGDLVLCIRATIGRLAVADGRYCLGRGVAGVRPSKAVDADFLRYFLIAAADALDAAGVGTTFRQIDKKTLIGWPMLLPPLGVQRSIVKKLRAGFARSESVRKELACISPLQDRYQQKILQAAFTGKLTEDWRSKNHFKPRPTQAAGDFKPPYQLPTTWEWVPLADLGVLDRGRSRHRPRNAPHLYGGPYPFVQTGDIKAANGCLTSFSQTYSEAGLAQSRIWPKGTLCITIAANIAETAILQLDACFPDSVVGFKPQASVCRVEYVEFFFRTAKSELEAFAPATAQKNINLETLRCMRVPRPPVEEQAEIVARLTTELGRMKRIAVEAAQASALLNRLETANLAKLLTT